MDTIQLDVPLFIRLLELAREDVKQDADLHDVAEIVTKLSQDKPVTMADYDQIVAFMKEQGKEDELDTVKRLGGITKPSYKVAGA
jgi:hypothetical protein